MYAYVETCKFKLEAMDPSVSKESEVPHENVDHVGRARNKETTLRLCSQPWLPKSCGGSLSRINVRRAQHQCKKQALLWRLFQSMMARTRSDLTLST